MKKRVRCRWSIGWLVFIQSQAAIMFVYLASRRIDPDCDTLWAQLLQTSFLVQLGIAQLFLLNLVTRNDDDAKARKAKEAKGT